MNVPKLRFPQFTDPWQKKPLNTAWAPRGKRNSEGRFGKNEVLSVSGEKGVVNQIDHLGRSYAGLSVDNYHIVETGDIVYTKSPLKANPFGIIKANRGPAGIVSTLYAVYEVLANQDPFFWDRYFELDDRTNSYLMPLVHIGAKNDMKINNERVLIDPVVYPSFSEQNKISEFFDVIDAKLDHLRRKIETLSKFKLGLMQALFSQRLRFSKDTGGPYPAWKEFKLGALGELYGGLMGKSAADFGEGSRFVTYRQVFEAAEIRPDQCGYVKIGKNETQNLVLPGDVLFTGSSETPGEIGFASVLTKDIGELYLNSFCFGFRPREQAQLLPAFSKYLFHSPDYRMAVYPLAQGSTRYNLSKSEFLKLKLSLPHPDEQLAISNALSAMDDKIDAASEQLSLMQQFKKGLLQKMFV